jgi:hypothetical protein
MDKGNTTAVLSSKDYHKKIKSILDDPMYKRLTFHPTIRIEKQTASLIMKSDIPEEIMKRLLLHSSVPPRLYELPKIHKKDMSLRPAVNCITSPIYLLVKHLMGLLNPFVGHSSFHIKNSEAFIQKLSAIHLQGTDILVSFDMVSLFTKVPFCGCCYNTSMTRL